MSKQFGEHSLFRAAVLTVTFTLSSALSQVQPQPIPLPNTGQQITPMAPPNSRFVMLNPRLPDHPNWLAGQAATTVVSPDHNTLLVLTSGYNRVYTEGESTPPYPWYGPDSNEYVFIYDISRQVPSYTPQVLQIPSSYHGIVFDPSGRHFYVAGGPSDMVHTMTLGSTGWSEDTPPALTMKHGTGIGLNIKPNGALQINSALGVLPCAAGVAISSDGRTLVVANYYNDSLSIFTGGYGNWVRQPDLDLRPGKSATNPQTGVPGGEYPFWVVIKGAGPSATAYVSSIRDREIDVVSLRATPAVTARIHVKGQPNKMTLNTDQSALFVAEDQSDTVDVINTGTNEVVETIPVIASLLPSSLSPYKGANPNSVALSPDETQLYVTDGNLNCISVIALGGTHIGDHVVGLIPTGWYPNSTSLVSAVGNPSSVYVYVANQKSPTGANPEWCYGGYGPPGSHNCNPANQYNPQLTRGGLQSFPLPNASQLAALTQTVMVNDHFSYTESASDAAVMAAVRQGIRHVIFILKENRTYDQILGDLPNNSNGDPSLTEFGETITPNQHALAQQFVTLDNFMDTAEVSYDGWHWSNAAQAPDVVEHQYPVAYAYRGLSLDSEGAVRNVNVAIPAVSTGSPQGNVAARQAANPFTSSDPDDLPGQTDTDAPDGPNNEVNTGYLWDSALRAGLTVRNYGFFIDTTRYSTTAFAIPMLRNPFATSTTVAYPANIALSPFTDPYFRGFDNNLPDYWRYTEWARDFDAQYNNAGGSDLPALTLVRFMHDHTGSYATAIDGVNTPDLEIADNDYAVGLLVQKVANSRFANNTLIFVLEDDSQDGGDHVDSHRSIVFVAGSYVKSGAVVSTQYSTLNFIRTVEEVLGLPQINAQLGLPPMMNLNDALARPMADIFNTTPSSWTFTAVPSAMLYGTSLPLPPQPAGVNVPKPAHDAKYWAQVTQGLDFTDADRVDAGGFNRILWEGMMGNKPYPAAPSHKDLRQNRDELLARYRQSLNRN